MELDPVNKALIGGFFVVAGLVMLIFRRDVAAFHEDWFGALRQYFPLFMPHGRTLTVFIVVFGILSVLGGALVLLLALDLS